ncbi:MAG TPA: hypothetical protein VHA13_01320 [Gammaproteobacteria bacterium]|nr:hypothetical protein [Gammaproteobacteria bacterium]
MSQDRANNQQESISSQRDNLTQENFAENLAFIVNIPLALEFKDSEKTHLDFEATLNKIKATQNAYLQGYTPETSPPFKMVFCVNSHTAQIEFLNTFKKQWDLAKTNNSLWKEASEISVITQAWSGSKFPYGQIRNGLLHSKETQDEIKLFQEKGFYPYVAISDSDTGNRLVELNGEIKHIFAAIQQRLNKKLNSPPSEPSSPEEIKQHNDSPRVSMSISVKKGDLSEGEITPSNSFFIRPYLIAGGYRPTSTETNQETRTRSIQRDMHIREQLANTVNPLGPYFPEPNLFLDAKIADKVNFGRGSGEFLQLRKEVSQLIMQDMLNGKPINISNEEWLAQVQTNIQNNRHPERNTAITTFFDLAIETNTDRLFRKVEQMTEEINNNLVAQHHQNAVNAKPAFLLNRYDSNRNGKEIFTKIRDFINENKGNMSKTIEFYHELMYSQKREQPEYKGIFSIRAMSSLGQMIIKY